MTKNKKKQQRKTIIIIVSCILAAGSAVAFWISSQSDKIDVSIEQVFRKEVVHYVTATGKIEPELEVTISPDVSGEIIELHVKEGETVQTGALLFKIQPDVYINQVEQNRARLNLAKSQSLESKARKLKAEDEFRKASILYSDKLISDSDYLTAKTNAEASRAAYEAALFTIKQNESLLDQSLEQLKKTTVTSPMNGTVIALDSKPGERVVGTGQFQGTNVLRIANLDSMQVEVEVNENDIVNVNKGDSVIVSVDAFGERQFNGIVNEISNSAITQSEGTQEEVTNFSVKIRILNHDRLLKPGMSATADIETERVQNALVVPIQSVTLRETDSDETHLQGKKQKPAEKEERNGNSIASLQHTGSRQGVFVVENNTVLFRPVETGTTDNTHIVILQGVAEGENVVSGSYTAIIRLLKDGSRVKLKSE